MDAEEFRRRGKEMIDYVADYLENIRDRRVIPEVQPGYIRELIPDHAPENGESWEDVFKDIERVIMPGASSPACTELEIVVLDWLGKMLNLPGEFLSDSGGHGGGVIQGTACEATLIALLSARAREISNYKRKFPDQRLDDVEIMSKFVAYCSDEAHSSVERAGLIASIKMRYLPTDGEMSLRGHTLQEAINKDRSQGLMPIFVCATLGTTNYCAFDNTLELGTVCDKEGVWMHIDAAYAGNAFICPEFRPLLDGVQYAESFDLNVHKWLNVNFDCSAMWVRNSALISEAFNVDLLILRHDSSGKMPDYRICMRRTSFTWLDYQMIEIDVEFIQKLLQHWQIPLSRRFRSLKLWFVLRMYGHKGLQECIRKDVRLAHEFEDLVKTDNRFEVVAKVIMGLVCFRLKRSNELNEKLLKAVNADGRIHIVLSKVKDVYCLRLAICASKTNSNDMTFAWKVIQEVTSKILNSENECIK